MKIRVYRQQLIALLAITNMSIPAPLDCDISARRTEMHNARPQILWTAVTIIGALATGTCIYIQRERIKTLLGISETTIEKSLLSEKEDISQSDQISNTAAFQNHHEDFTQQAKQYNEQLASKLPQATLNQIKQFEANLLVQSIQKKDIPMVQYLLEIKQTNPNIPNKANIRALGHTAYLLNNCTSEENLQIYQNIIALLLEYGADPNKRCTKNSQNSPTIRAYCSQRIKSRLSPSLKEALGVHFDE